MCRICKKKKCSHPDWICFSVCLCARPKKRDGLKDDRRVEQKSNHLIATFFISIFCFMAAEGRRATLAVIHGRWGGRWAAPSLIGTRPPAHPKHPHNYCDEYDLFFVGFPSHSLTLPPSSCFSGDWVVLSAAAELSEINNLPFLVHPSFCAPPPWEPSPPRLGEGADTHR